MARIILPKNCNATRCGLKDDEINTKFYTVTKLFNTDARIQLVNFKGLYYSTVEN